MTGLRLTARGRRVVAAAHTAAAALVVAAAVSAPTLETLWGAR